MAGKVGAEEQIARVAEVRDIAVEDLDAELQDAADKVRILSQSLRKMAHDPFGALAPGDRGAGLGAGEKPQEIGAAGAGASILTRGAR
jgi:hypothetical protein